MPDYDLARIYGYETKRFNEQVKNNEDRFPKEFAFCLTDAEVRLLLRSKKSTAKVLSSLRRYNPCAFTEQRKNNEDRFQEEFRFRLTREEIEDLVRCKIYTSRNHSMFTGQNGGSRKPPYAFTEQRVCPFAGGDKARKRQEKECEKHISDR